MPCYGFGPSVVALHVLVERATLDKGLEKNRPPCPAKVVIQPQEDGGHEAPVDFVLTHTTTREVVEELCCLEHVELRHGIVVSVKYVPHD